MAEAGARGWQVRVRGLVQGVGFRPTVWRLATEAGLKGQVLNDSEGVLIRVVCERWEIDHFIAKLRREVPPLARIDSVEVLSLDDLPGFVGFTIGKSQAGLARTGIVPDAATCAECRDEIADADNRRFGYAFTNCTNCGPRLSITRAIPYDRANTSMDRFTMCTDCQREYEDPLDRRFHAQPNACPACGPKLDLVDAAGNALDGDPLRETARLLNAGKIVAIKGLGGFQLACDATLDAVVARLRQRKRRPAKPFALMVRDLIQAAEIVRLDADAETALRSPAAPIVLARKRAGTRIAECVAPRQKRLGLMLPNTPLHHLLFRHLDFPLVMTSGNLSSDPQIIANDEALARLGGIADAFLLHDRDIVNRLDDSVVQVVGGRVCSLRRARGHAPSPLVLHDGFRDAPDILATGSDLKNTFCLLKGGHAIVSQHIGDMESAICHRDFRSNLALYQDMHDLEPKLVAVDGHPGYFSSRIGHEIAAGQGADTVSIQHHHAHVAAVLAEHGYGPNDGPVLGVVLDGLGYGIDGTIWGGEFLLADFRDFERLAHFQPIALPGGDQANRHPWRNTFAHLSAVFGPDMMREIRCQFGEIPVLADLETKPISTLSKMIDRGVNAPLSTSAGRLFDAVAGALGICFDEITFEGQAAMELQVLAEEHPGDARPYPCDVGPVIGWGALWRGILGDLQSGRTAPEIAARFHATLAACVSQNAVALAKTRAIDTVVLSGGVFQNGLLQSRVLEALAAANLKALSPRQFPSNDGGISLGQATIAAARMTWRR
ncbi:MAG: carbamoyltransferase HypF [Sedimentitalea sp.]|nr:carbamoyltransferase HypF [Sedimentitalea sp.]